MSPSNSASHAKQKHCPPAAPLAWAPSPPAPTLDPAGKVLDPQAHPCRGRATRATQENGMLYNGVG